MPTSKKMLAKARDIEKKLAALDGPEWASDSSDDDDPTPATTRPTASQQFAAIEARARAQADTGRRLRSGSVHDAEWAFAQLDSWRLVADHTAYGALARLLAQTDAALGLPFPYQAVLRLAYLGNGEHFIGATLACTDRCIESFNSLSECECPF